MKGAKGLLISITGGRDLTLFEVDEAATRIREEVDQDANIILGATFDEELEGVIRVSVVATGIDKVAAEINTPPISIRQPQKPVQAARPIEAPRPAAPAPQPQPQLQAEAPRQADPIADAIRAAEAAPVAAAIQPAQDEAEFRPASRLFAATQPAAPVQPAAPQMAAPMPQPVQQPAPQAAPRVEMPAPVQPRMPRVEDFPPVARAEMEQVHGQPHDHEERGPMGLLKRLTQGLSRREEEQTRLQPAQPREPRLLQPAPEARRAPSADGHLYAPRRGQLDDQGRLSVQPRAAHDDDQLEIPAFLRRQAN
jgi:cell division protein FtsZ